MLQKSFNALGMLNTKSKQDSFVYDDFDPQEKFVKTLRMGIEVPQHESNGVKI